METMHAAGRRRLPPVPRPAGDRSVSGRVAADDDANTDQSATQVIDTRQIAADLVEAELAALTEAASDRKAAAPDDSGVDDDAIDVTEQLPLAELVALIYDADAEVDADDAAAEDAPEASAEESAEESADDEADDEADAETEVPTDAQADPPATPDVVAGEVDTPAAPVDDQDPAQQFVARLRTSATDFAGAAGAESAVVREAVPPARHRRARCRLVLRYADGDVADVTLLGPAGAPGRPSRHGFDRQILRWLGAGLVQDDAWVVDDPDAPDGVAVDLTVWAAAG